MSMLPRMRKFFPNRKYFVEPRIILDFTIAVAHQWGALVTGGSVVGLVVVYEHLSGRSITGWQLWLGIALSLLLAFFFAWLKERRAVDELKQTLASLDQNQSNILLPPEKLVGLYDGLTSIQGKKLASAYVGQFMRFSGSISDVMSGVKGTTVLFAKSEGQPSILMSFDEKLTDPLSVLRIGDIIDARGQIREIERSAIFLERCEIVEFATQQEAAKRLLLTHDGTQN